MNTEVSKTIVWPEFRVIFCVTLILLVVSIGLVSYTYYIEKEFRSIEQEIYNIEQEIYHYKNDIRI